MKKIILLGELGNKFGKVHNYDVKNTSEAIRALGANLNGFKKHLIENKNVGYHVFIGENGVKDDAEFFEPVSKKDEIKIIPVVQGAASGELKVIAGIALIAIGVILAPTGIGSALIPVGIGLTLSGVVQLLTPLPKAPTPPQRQEDKAGYQFNGPVNTTVQGFPVPLGYGRMIVGSAVISAGITVEDITA